jgi:hypothetical protein
MAVSNQELDIIVDLLSDIFENDPAEEQEAFRVLAKMLMEGPIPLGIRVMLANRFNPDMRDTVKRRLTFKRERGASKTFNERQAAAVVWNRIKAGDQREAALQHAVDTLDVSFSFAEKAFAKWKDRLDRFEKKLRAITRTTE